MSVQIEIFVGSSDALLIDYDVLLVQRSVSGSSGPWESITDDAPTAATLLGEEAAPFFVVGQTLRIQHKTDPEISITFTGTNPLTASEVVSQINDEAGFAIATNESSQIRLDSDDFGTDSSLEITGGSAMDELGFVVNQRDVGQDAHIPLVSGEDTYLYTDSDGAVGYFYRTAAFNTTNSTTGTFSEAIEGTVFTPLPDGSLSLGYIDLVTATGIASEGQKVTLFPLQFAEQVSGFGVGLERNPIVLTTDINGHAETNLVRGLRLRVVFDGTPLIREITVPDEDTFNIMALVESAPDLFTVAIPNLPAAPRRSM